MTLSLRGEVIQNIRKGNKFNHFKGNFKFLPQDEVFDWLKPFCTEK